MKKFELIILASILIFSAVHMATAQNNQTTLEQLQANPWEMEDLDGMTFTMDYGNDQVTLYMDSSKIGIDQYYLSDIREMEFDSTKVGQVQDGKYIIFRSIESSYDGVEKPVIQSGNFGIFEIKQFNKNWLMVRNIKHKHQLKFKAKS